jgi:hypothetical protein
MQLQRMMPSRVEAVTFAMDEDTKSRLGYV